MFCRIQLQSAWNVGVSCLSGFLTSFARRTFLVVSASTDHSAWNLFRCKRTQVWNEWNKNTKYYYVHETHWLNRCYCCWCCCCYFGCQKTYILNFTAFNAQMANEWMQIHGSHWFFCFFSPKFSNRFTKNRTRIENDCKNEMKTNMNKLFWKKNTFQIEAAWNGNQMEKVYSKWEKKEVFDLLLVKAHWIKSLDLQWKSIFGISKNHVAQMNSQF